MIRIRHADETPHEASEINVTPFIDVMLVLLVIFMVTRRLGVFRSLQRCRKCLTLKAASGFELLRPCQLGRQPDNGSVVQSAVPMAGLVVGLVFLLCSRRSDPFRQMRDDDEG